MTKLSPLDAWHREHGGRMVDFAGWELPVQFSSVIQEHIAVRQAAGLFDISHMAQADVSGPRALDWLQYMLPNNIDVKVGRGVYSPMCNFQGGIIDDLYVFRLGEERFFLVMNASREEADLAWLRQHQFSEVTLDARSSRAGIALQGPHAEAVLSAVVPEATSLSRNGVIETELTQARVIVSRTGYTGEDGFELFVPAVSAAAIWEALYKSGQHFGLVAAGLGARDTLRLEMGYPLYGHEGSENCTPYDIGYGWTVKLQKNSDFIGREALESQQRTGIEHKLIGLILDERGVPRQGWTVTSDGRARGVVTSGTHSPSLNRGICLALVDSGAGEPYKLEHNGKTFSAHAVELPFYKEAGARRRQELILQ
ncbi:MAG: glycine cleavage system aminomethyltransferase GcvT [Armatimonadetes bacterium]|nr:glycine cleavage system aminomethyltransferase GcvT [Armatimonadota bacterium]